MDQQSINIAISQAVRHCLSGENLLDAIADFLGELRKAAWDEDSISRVDKVTRRMLGLIYEPSPRDVVTKEKQG
jgi:hypothetical protein